MLFASAGPMCLAVLAYGQAGQAKTLFSLPEVSEDYMLQDKIEAIKAQAAAASQGGSVSHARLQERESYIISLQVHTPMLSHLMQLNAAT